MQNQPHYPLSQENDSIRHSSSSPYPQIGVQMGQVQPMTYPQVGQPYQMGQPYPQQQPQGMMPPQQVGFQQPQGNAQVIQVQQFPTSRYPQILNCHQCKRPVQTVINYEAGNGAYVMGGLVAAVGLWLGCCLIPCFIEDCKDALHFCPNCTSQIGRKKFLFE